MSLSVEKCPICDSPSIKNGSVVTRYTCGNNVTGANTTLLCAARKELILLQRNMTMLSAELRAERVATQRWERRWAALHAEVRKRGDSVLLTKIEQLRTETDV